MSKNIGEFVLIKESKKLGLIDEAIKAYQRAIELVRQEPEERYLKKQLSDIL